MPRFVHKIIQNIKNNSTRWLLGTLFIFGLLFFLGGMISDYSSPEIARTFFEATFIGLGSSLLIGGISSVVLKVIAVEGYFLDAVAETTLSRNALKRLNREKLSEVWLNTNRLMLLKNTNLQHSSQTHKNDIEELRVKLYGQLAENFENPKDQFVKEHTRQLNISWEDEKKERLFIEDRTNSTAIPFDPSKPLTWVANVESEKGIKIQNDLVTDVEAKLINANGEELVVKRLQQSDQTQVNTEFTSKPKDKHEIFKIRHWRIPIDEDPNLNTYSPYLVLSSKVSIANNAHGVSCVVSWLGPPVLYEVTSGSIRIKCGQTTSIRLNHQVMLPNEGYSLYFFRENRI